MLHLSFLLILAIKKLFGMKSNSYKMYNIKLLFKHFLMLVVLICFKTNLNAQGRNTNWCFGDSAGINFSNLSNPLNFKSACKTRGDCATISDSSGNLLFYAGGINIPLTGLIKTLKIFDNNNQIMNNGDSLFGDTWYESEVIVPFPDHDSLYYVFAVEQNGSNGAIYYNVVLKKTAIDTGVVIQKNVLLLQTPIWQTLQAIKHGNGHDWWLVARLEGIPSDTFFVWKITATGISNPISKKVGFNSSSVYGRICFNSVGSKFIEIGLDGIIEEFNFNRCTGDITSNKIIRQPNSPFGNWFPMFSSVAYSANDKFVYIVQTGNYVDTILLYQLDMSLTDPWANRDTLWNIKRNQNVTTMKLAPDHKIYLTTWIASDSLVSLYWPFPDNYFTTENSYLSVINTPDSPGVSCNFTPFSFYLSGARTYAGLSNQPNYSLGPTADSCIFAAVTPQPTTPVAALNLMYHQQWQTLFVNANTIKGKKYTLRIYNTLGKLVYENSGKTDTYFTKDVACPNYSAGVYIVTLETEKEKLSGKFVVN